MMIETTRFGAGVCPDLVALEGAEIVGLSGRVEGYNSPGSCREVMEKRYHPLGVASSRHRWQSVGGGAMMRSLMAAALVALTTPALADMRIVCEQPWLLDVERIEVTIRNDGTPTV